MSGKERNCYGETRWNRYPDEESAFRKKKARAQTPPNSDPVLSQDLSLVPAPPVLEPAKLGALLSRPTVKLEPGILDAIKERRAELFAELLKEEPNTARSTKTASNFFSKWLRQYAKLPGTSEPKLYDYPVISDCENEGTTAPDLLLACMSDTAAWVCSSGNRSGQPMKRSTPHHYFCGLNREWNLYFKALDQTMNKTPRPEVNFFIDSEWQYAKAALDTLMPKLNGKVAHHQPPSDHDMKLILSSDFLAKEDPWSLLHRRAFTLMTEIWVRGGEELRALELAFFTLIDEGMPLTSPDSPGERLRFDANKFFSQKTKKGDSSDFRLEFEFQDMFPNHGNPRFCLVMAKSRHRSINAVRTYNKENITQQAAVSHTMHLRAAGIQVQHTDVVRALSANDRFATNRNVVAPLECTDNHIDNRVASAPAFTTPYDDPFLWDSAFLEEYDNTANGFW
eukprot:gene10073-11921_t